MDKLMNDLAKLRDLDEISEIAYQFSEFLRRLDPNCARDVLLAGCLVAQRTEEGDVCVELTQVAASSIFGKGTDSAINAPSLDDWERALRNSKLVGLPGDARPLILDESGRLYLQKFWKYEARLAEQLLERACKEPEMASDSDLKRELDSLFGTDLDEVDWQKVAAWSAIRNKLTIISGGPGTGKTTTVIKILILMAKLGSLEHMALAAPTGKAASRLMESITGALDRIKPEKSILQQLPDDAVTLHKLLGARRHGGGFRYNRENPLPYNLVVIDEASMVDLALMVRLVDALPKNAKLILLGDKDQLASVEAGAVLGSICAKRQNKFSSACLKSAKEIGLKIPETALESSPKPLTDHIVLLEKSYRFGEDSGIGKLSSAILSGDTQNTLEVLEPKKFEDTTIISFKDLSGFKQILSKMLQRNFRKIVEERSVHRALNLISHLGILCVHRRGPLGANQVNLLAEQLLRDSGQIPATREWYIGKPVMVTRNDYSLGLRNGEIGLTLQDEQGELKVYFPKREGEYSAFLPSRLSFTETAYAITVHKSQGSEFEEVVVVLPAHVSAISTRELLYTAVTRARKRCTIIGSPKVLSGAVDRSINRSSGLEDRLWDLEKGSNPSVEVGN
ncbi:MAG: exodeoxyribonuclease V subunit alpha [Balneolaceae bacterium]|nr:exodeoxyribonuclease V subunit alpha [Balneolaceae bacterium]